jgi:hypothetical protein
VFLAAFPGDATLDAGELEILAQKVEVLRPQGIGDAVVCGLLGSDLGDGARPTVEWGMGEGIEVDCSDAVSDDGDAIGEQTGACDREGGTIARGVGVGDGMDETLGHLTIS